MSVRRSLTFISGNRPVRSATATRNIAGPLELPQQVDLPFGIRRVGAGHPCAQVVLQLGARRRGLEQPLVQQFVEQQRKRRDLVGEKLRLGAQLDQALARGLVLVEQREIDRAPADPLDHVQQARRARSPRGRRPRSPAAAAASASAAAASRLVEASQVAAVAHQVEALEDRCRVAQPRRAQRRESPRHPGQAPGSPRAPAPHRPTHPAPPVANSSRRKCPLTRSRCRAICASRSGQSGRSHGEREPRATRLVLRQFVRLLVVALLEPVLDPPQETIRVAELLHGRRRAAASCPRAAAAPSSRLRVCSRGSPPPRISWNACTMNSISRMPPGPSLTLPCNSRRSTSREISSFISRSDSNTPKSR